MEKLTTKQRGDAAEHYVISMLGFNSIPVDLSALLVSLSHDRELGCEGG